MDRQEILKQDNAIIMAKFLICLDYEKIKQEFNYLCELGCTIALDVYYFLHKAGENPIIDAMVDGIPDIHSDEILQDVLEDSVNKYGGERAEISSEDIDNIFLAELKHMKQKSESRSSSVYSPTKTQTQEYFDYIMVGPTSLLNVRNADIVLKELIQRSQSGENVSYSKFVLVSLFSIYQNNGEMNESVAKLLTHISQQPHSEIFLRYKQLREQFRDSNNKQAE
jgi:hypothetical protein